MSDPILPTKCPTCGATPKLEHRPFCSKRCQEIDLGRWFKGSYKVETDEIPEPEELLED